MSEAVAEKAEKAPAAAGGGGNKKILIIVLAVNVLLAGGLGYVLISNKSHAAEQAKAAGKAKAKAAGHDAEEGEGEEAKEEEEAEPEAEGEEEGKKDAKHGKFGPLLDVGTFVANLASVPGQPPRYCKVSVYVEAKNEEAKVAVEGAVVPIKSEALMLISNAKAEDLIGQDKITALSNELLKRANKLVGKGAIKRVYFSELVIQ